MMELPKLPRKTLVISSYAPPATSGGSLYLFRIFSNFDPDSYCFLTSHNNFKANTADQNNLLPCRYYFFDRTNDPARKRSRFFAALQKPFRLFSVVRQSLKVIGNEQIELLIGTTNRGDIFMLTYLLSKISGVPYCPWLIDLYRENNFPEPWKKLANFFEPILIRGAKFVFLSCSGFEDHYRSRYPDLNKFRVVNIGGFDDGPKRSEANVTGVPTTLLFSGSIYWAHERALDEIISACRELNDIPFRLLLYVSGRFARSDQRYSGIPNVSVQSAERPEMLAALNNADILLLPFSWDTGSDAVINTAIPTKLMDYLLAGRPILIYAPKDSYVSRYGRERGFASVVDERNPALIRVAIRKIVSDKEYAAGLVKNAKKTFYENHDARINSQKLYDSLSELG